VEKSLSWLLGERKYKTLDESDALAVAVCHALLRNSIPDQQKQVANMNRGKSLKQAFKHLE